MKHRLVLVLALLTLAVTASAAYAAGLAPQTGAWKGTAGESGEFVSFKVAKTADGYRVKSTRLFVAAGCDAPNPNDSTFVQAIRRRGVTVKLSAAGKRLRGSRKLTSSTDGGKVTETVSITVNVVSARRAKVVVKAKHDTKRNDPTSNADDCEGRLVVTAKPQ